MIVKVCGMTDNQNIEALIELGVDMIGLNFYEKSIRYVASDLDPIFIPKIGVFVNPTIEEIHNKVESYQLSYVQLHGDETVNFTREISDHYSVIKAIGVDSVNDINKANLYNFVDYILFDKKSKQFGGTGVRFDWSLLNKYNGDVPFLLAGGISPSDSTEIKTINNSLFEGVDINSKFESKAGIKDIGLVETFISKLNR